MFKAYVDYQVGNHVNSNTTILARRHIFESLIVAHFYFRSSHSEHCWLRPIFLGLLGLIDLDINGVLSKLKEKKKRKHCNDNQVRHYKINDTSFHYICCFFKVKCIVLKSLKKRGS